MIQADVAIVLADEPIVQSHQSFVFVSRQGICMGHSCSDSCWCWGSSAAVPSSIVVCVRALLPLTALYAQADITVLLTDESFIQPDESFIFVSGRATQHVYATWHGRARSRCTGSV